MTESGQNSVSGQNRDRQNLEIQTPDRKFGQQTDTGQDFPENQDKNETRTGHGFNRTRIHLGRLLP